MSNLIFIMQQVVVTTKSPKSNKQYVWEAGADSSSYIIREETDPEKMLPRGTQITLFLRVLISFFFFSLFLYSCMCASPF
jgi:HSP90 family molecular chaperone